MPGGHELLPWLIEQQKTVHPDEQLASGPHNDVYAVPGRSANLNGLTASADPTIAERAEASAGSIGARAVARDLDELLGDAHAAARSSCCNSWFSSATTADVNAPRDHRVQAERTVVGGEEQLAADLARKVALQAAG